MAEETDVKRVAFVSTRIAGTDGVSLEIAKWVHVLERAGVECCYIAGESDRLADRSAIIEEAHFNHLGFHRERGRLVLGAVDDLPRCATNFKDCQVFDKDFESRQLKVLVAACLRTLLSRSERRHWVRRNAP